MDGLTGKIKFDQYGIRTDFQLEIVELKKKGLQKVNQTFNITKSSKSLFRLEPGMIRLVYSFQETLPKAIQR